MANEDAVGRVEAKNAARKADGYVFSQHTCEDIDALLTLAKSRLQVEEVIAAAREALSGLSELEEQRFRAVLSALQKGAT
jgi:hypothetical protein